MNWLPIFISMLGLVLESISGFFQQDVRETFKPSTFEFMFFTSFYIGILATLVWILSGEYVNSIQLFMVSKDALIDQVTVALLHCIGNVFIFMVLSRRGPIVLALVTTTRKVFTVLHSFHTSASQLFGAKGLGILLVVVGLICECTQSILEKTKPKKVHHDTHHDPHDSSKSHAKAHPPDASPTHNAKYKSH